MIQFKTLALVLLCLGALGTTSLVSAQNRNFGARTFTMDDGAGHTFTMQAPSGMTGNVTYSMPLPPAGNPPAGFVNVGTSAGQTLFWNGTTLAWEASNVITNNSNGNGTNVTITAPLLAQSSLGVSGATTLSALSTAGVVHNSATGLLSTSQVATADIANGAVDLASKVTGILPVANGGTGSATQNFVDLATAQSVAGNKTFTGTTTANTLASSGATITGGAISATPISGSTGSFSTLSSAGNSNIATGASTTNSFGNGANASNYFGMGGGTGGGNTNNQFGSTAGTFNSFGNGALNNNVGVGSTGNFFGGAFFGNPQSNNIGGGSGSAANVVTNYVAEADNSATTRTTIGLTTAATATSIVIIGGGSGNSSVTINGPTTFGNTVNHGANGVSGSNFSITGGSISGASGSFTTLAASTSETFSNLNTAGVVHNAASGALSTSQIATADIANGAVDLTSKVTGVLPVANGGTGGGSFLPLSGGTMTGSINMGNNTITNTSSVTLNANGGSTRGVGVAYRDAVPVAWGTINANGTLGTSFGITSISGPYHPGYGLGMSLLIANYSSYSSLSVVCSWSLTPSQIPSLTVGGWYLGGSFDGTYVNIEADNGAIAYSFPTAVNFVVYGR